MFKFVRRWQKGGTRQMEWYQVAIVFAVAFLVTYVSVPFSKWLARKMGAIDFPSNRRVNKEPVPRCGGVALYLGMVAACFVISWGCGSSAGICRCCSRWAT